MSTTVLIAESNNFLLDTLKIVFSLLGFTVIGTTSKISDIDTLALKTKPDLLVFDLHLPREGMPGTTNLKHLKEQLPEMKILALGIHEATDQFAETILNAGFDGFWNKYDNRAGFIKILNSLFP